jgi:UDP-glucose 4-epimerase
MNILITGGLGFLGARIARHLYDEGHYVLRGTRRDVGSVDCSNEQFPVVQTFWFDAEKLENICSDIDVIVHVSGMSAQECACDPVGALMTNAVATASILQAAVKSHVRRFIYVSTIHVYTSCLQGVISEQTTLSNLHPYATSNRAAEDVVLSAQKYHLIDGVVIRLMALGRQLSHLLIVGSYLLMICAVRR